MSALVTQLASPITSQPPIIRLAFNVDVLPSCLFHCQSVLPRCHPFFSPCLKKGGGLAPVMQARTFYSQKPCTPSPHIPKRFLLLSEPDQLKESFTHAVLAPTSSTAVADGWPDAICDPLSLQYLGCRACRARDRGTPELPVQTLQFVV